MARSSTTYTNGPDHPMFGEDRFEGDRPPCRQRVRDRRLELGLSHDHAAHLMGVDRNTWRRYENGNLTVPQIRAGKEDQGLVHAKAHILLEIAMVLQVSPYWILYGVEKEAIDGLAGPEAAYIINEVKKSCESTE